MMKRFERIIGLVCFGVFAVQSLAMAHSKGALNEVIVKMSGPETARQLAKQGFDVAGVNHQNETVVVFVQSDIDKRSLAKEGFQILSSRILDPKRAPDPDYKDASEIEAMIHQYAAAYPNLTYVRSIGQSLEGREIWAIKISDNPTIHEADEPSVLFNAMHHAREVMTPEVPLDTIEQLLTMYGSDARVTDWVDSTEIWIVPMFNVDGNDKVWNSDSYWRKNTRGGYGVDINRNYPFEWNACGGSSGSKYSQTYRGPSAASEPETKALMDFVAEIGPVFDISYHSYSELVLYPYGCDGKRTPTQNVVEGFGKEIAGLIKTDDDSGTYTPGTPWDILYAVDGDDISWMYNAHHVIPYVIELNSSYAGFQPPYSLRQPTVEKLRPAWTRLLDRVHQSGVRGQVTGADGRPLLGATVGIEELSGTVDMEVVTWNVKADGTYHAVLEPSDYRFTFTVDGMVEDRMITVGSDLEVVDIQM